MEEGRNKTTAKAQEALERLSNGGATINQIRKTYELKPIDNGNSLMATKVKLCKNQV